MAEENKTASPEDEAVSKEGEESLDETAIEKKAEGLEETKK